MITTRLQAFYHGRQAKLLSSDGLLVQNAPRPPLLAGVCVRFFCMLEVNDVDMVEIIDVMDGQSKVKDDNGKAKSKVPMKIPRSKLVGKAASITLKLMVKPLAKVLTKV